MKREIKFWALCFVLGCAVGMPAAWIVGYYLHA
jgi:hypothetical protein